MNSVLPIPPSVDCEIFAGKALAAWEALETRYGQQLSIDEIDHLFARFVFGLTQPFHGHDDPQTHLHVCRTVLALKLSPDRIDRTLHRVPKTSDEWIATAFDSIEALGVKGGRALSDQLKTTRSTT
ncbi:Uncharacterised protein [Starkeya nomas]|uniref:Uncharacterized protein n=1 Tax=Starkeya nomas TaxID=2666134 RepID=A0A5S9R3C2_9HYPH|nr:hypothetical protein [Starkeya nomas]CAA0128884.1 Uncharacterised protein [Starkeya nomas]